MSQWTTSENEASEANMFGQVDDVGADDVQAAVEAAVAALRPAVNCDWSARAGDLEWDCWETVEHLADDLFCYAAQLAANPTPPEHHVRFHAAPRRASGPDNAIWADRSAGPVGLLETLGASGGLLTAVIRTAPPSVRAHHPYGLSDPEGFAAMGVVETLVHIYDVAQTLHMSWRPSESLCTRVLARLMPDISVSSPRDRDGDAWSTLLWATGRVALPGLPRQSNWRWDATVRSPAPSTHRPHRTSEGLGLVTLIVPDYDDALAFYVDKLGFELREDTLLGGSKRWVVIAPPGGIGASLLLARADGERQQSRVGDQTGGRVAFFLYTENFDRDHQRMLATGVHFTEYPRREPYGTVAVFTDPYGNRWDLIEQRSPQ